MRFDNSEDIIQLTPNWTGERFPNGRPRVPDSILRRFDSVTTEEAWGVMWHHGYKYQFQSDFKMIHPDKILVGRAVTAVMVPKRPDLDTYLLEYGQKVEGRKGFFNSWVIESLVEDDVLVVDMFDKVYEGTYVGGNLSTAVSRRTKRGGQLIWGGIRDVQQVMSITNIQTFIGVMTLHPFGM
jgi:regulator of RNase E activity RraA